MSLNPSLYATLSASSEPTEVTAQYVWGARPGHRDEMVRRDRDTDSDGTLDERLYCLMDYFNPTAIVDDGGAVVERYSWSAFGLRTVMDSDWVERTSSAYAFDFGFHGQFLDHETGYYNYGYRFYSPEVGRWLSRDPIGEDGGVNLYAFVMNGPVNGVDYLGLVEPTLGYNTIMKPSDFRNRDNELPTCGQGAWQIQWKLNAATKEGGYIVQHITMEANVKDCLGNDITNPRYRRLTYTEAWSVYPGKVGPTFAKIVDDTFRYSGTGNCTEGSFKITGIAEFAPGTNIFPPEMKINAVPEAGGLLSIEPAVVIQGGTGQINREFEITWDCCSQSDSPSKYRFNPENA